MFDLNKQIHEALGHCVHDIKGCVEAPPVCKKCGNAVVASDSDMYAVINHVISEGGWLPSDYAGDPRLWVPLMIKLFNRWGSLEFIQSHEKIIFSAPDARKGLNVKYKKGKSKEELFGIAVCRAWLEWKKNA